MPNRKICFQIFLILVFVCVTGVNGGHSVAAQGDRKEFAQRDDAMVAAIFKKLDEDPKHSDSWRLLGKILAKENKNDGALEALQRAVELMPENAAAHYDLGNLQSKLGKSGESQQHFQKVYDLAPGSVYARRILESGFEPTLPDNNSLRNSPPSANQQEFVGVNEFIAVAADETIGDVQKASFEIQTFDGSDDLDRRIQQLDSNSQIDLQTNQPSAVGNQDIDKRWRLFGETGVLYNTNVALTPISRQLASNAESSAQWVANADLEWSAWKNDRWRAGPIARGNFTTNESQVSQLNLASFQVGSFFERELAIAGAPWISRLEYQFSIDQFGGETFGDRHSLTGSLTKINSTKNITYLYAILSSTEFRDDGGTPEVTSLDGNSYTIGVSRFFLTSSSRLPTWNMGLDYELADTEGQDFRYYSLRAHGQTTMTLANKLSLISSGALGFRTFPDFTGSVDRDEFTWRLGAKLKYQFNNRADISLTTNYDRFASDNDDFDLDRFTSGIITSFRY